MTFTWPKNLLTHLHIFDPYFWPSFLTLIFHPHFWPSFLTLIFDPHFLPSFFTLIFYLNNLNYINNFWPQQPQLPQQFLTTIFDGNFLMTIFDDIETIFDNWKDSPGDLTFETLITILLIENLNSVNHSYLTINCDTGQHSQFLRCFTKLQCYHLHRRRCNLKAARLRWGRFFFSSGYGPGGSG